MRLKALIGSSTLSLALVAAPALAGNVDVTGKNLTTGPYSDNDNTYTVADSNNENITNNGYVANTGVVDSRTGNNRQSHNTSGGHLLTGGLMGGADWDAVVNAAAGMTGLNSDLNVIGRFTNDTTGPNSDNDNRLRVRSNDSLYLRNVAWVTNVLDVDHRSGNNEQLRNTLVGSINTGGANVNVSTDTYANNSGNTGVAASNVANVNVTGVNHITGPRSENTNTYRINNSASVNVKNTADIDSTTVVDSRTGNNTQNRNTKGGSITTGGTDVTVNHITKANNGTAAATASSVVDVDANFKNDTTGPNSDNDNVLTVDNTSTTKVVNEADVDNVTVVDARSGNNDSSNNTEGGSIETGDNSFNFSSNTEVNS